MAKYGTFEYAQENFGCKGGYDCRCEGCLMAELEDGEGDDEHIRAELEALRKNPDNRP